MLKADQAPYFDNCPRCGIGGLETLKTHAFCVNCNYEEIYSDELCSIPQWALKALEDAKPNRGPRVAQLASTRVEVSNADSISASKEDFDGSAA